MLDIFVGSTNGTLVTDVDLGKMTIYQVFIGSHQGTRVPVTDFEKMTISQVPLYVDFGKMTLQFVPGISGFMMLMAIYQLFIGCTWGTLVTDVDIGKMTIYQVFIVCTWGTLVTDVEQVIFFTCVQ